MGMCISAVVCTVIFMSAVQTLAKRVSTCCMHLASWIIILRSLVSSSVYLHIRCDWFVYIVTRASDV